VSRTRLERLSVVTSSAEGLAIGQTAECDMASTPRRRGATPVSRTRKTSPEKAHETCDADLLSTPQSSWTKLPSSPSYTDKGRAGPLQRSPSRKLEASAASSGEACERDRRTSPVRKISSPERNWRDTPRVRSPDQRSRDVLIVQTHAQRHREFSTTTATERRESPNARKELASTPQRSPRHVGRDVGHGEQVRAVMRDFHTSSRMSLGRKPPDTTRRSLIARVGVGGGGGGGGVSTPTARLFSPRLQAQPVDPFVSASDSLFDSLMKLGFLSDVPTPCTYAQGPKGPGSVEITNDLKQVRDLFSVQMPEVSVCGVWRIENRALSGVYRAVCDSMGAAGGERSLWHGTSLGSIRNIALNGFNRAYCGRHGMKFGHGTYFSAAADYSVRFCDKKSARRVMLLANVLVGSWTKGSPDLVEAPHKDTAKLIRYDSTVDDVDSPGIFCIFRDFQALPLYVVLFSGSSA